MKDDEYILTEGQAIFRAALLVLIIIVSVTLTIGYFA